MTKKEAARLRAQHPLATLEGIALVLDLCMAKEAKDMKKRAKELRTGQQTQRKEKQHEAGCPRLQFWDAGEWECPCTCNTRKETETK